MSGPLLKLTIIPYNEPTAPLAIPAGPPFIVQFNPETYSETTEYDFGPEEPPAGGTASETTYKGKKARNYEFDLMLDGTGVSPAPPPIGLMDKALPASGLSVKAQIEYFKFIAGVQGKTHKPNYLMLVWGTLVVVTVMESMTVDYQMFSPLGLPIRAVMKVKFREHIEQELEDKALNLMSPDVDHQHQVRAGDHLTKIANETYKDPAFYLNVAKANNLDTVRNLTVGSTIHMPKVKG